MRLQRLPIQTQGLKEPGIAIPCGEAHGTYGLVYLKAKVFDKACGTDKSIEQWHRRQLTFDLVIETRPSDSVTGQGRGQAFGSSIIFKPDHRLIAERLKQGALYHPLRPDRQLGPWTLVLLIFTRIEAKHHPGIELGNMAMKMEAAAVDLDCFTARFDAFDRPGTGTKPEVFEGIAEFFITAGGKLGYGHTLLHVGVIAVQSLELQGLTAQAGNQLGKTRTAVEQVAITQVELLALSVIDAQVERIALGIGFAAPWHLAAEGLERAHLAETRQAAHQRQDA
ncbi:hypothetical protein D3C78_717710 [compost metagenome]